MANEQLNNYIEKALEFGNSQEKIKEDLLGAGWSEEKINESFLFIENNRKEKFIIPEAPKSDPSKIFTENKIEEVKSEPAIKKEEINNEPIEKVYKMSVQSANSPRVISKKIKLGLIIFSLFVLVGGFFAYAYVQKIGPFSPQIYSENNFFSGLLGKFSQIKSSSYVVSGDLNVGDRDNDAQPFSISEASNSVELKQKYYYDNQRLNNVSDIISRLNSLVGYSIYDPLMVVKKSYPTSIGNIFSGSYNPGSVVDPATGNNYIYQVTDGGKNFLLTITFETDVAINAIKNSYKYDAVNTIIDGKKVSFTKNTSSNIYMSSEPPKPFLIELSESMKTLPPDFSAKASFGVSSEVKSVEEIPDWLFNFNAEGDFGDLTYKVNAEALKKDKNYYLKINNFPNLFFFDIGAIKGKWISFPSTIDSNESQNNYSELSYLKEYIPEVEKEYKENSEKAIKLIKKITTIADEQKLIKFKSRPKVEKIDNRQLIKYELSIKKEVILPFYTKVQEEINKDPDFFEYANMVDQGLMDYLKSDEFNEIFDFFDKNNTFTFWTDMNGFPAIAQTAMRVVSPDEVTQLKDKQINIVFKMIVSKINEAVKIEAPVESLTIDEAADTLFGGAQNDAKDARIKAAMDQIKSEAEIFKKNNGYYNNTGNKINLSSCAPIAKTMLEPNSDFKSLCDDIQMQGSGSLTINISSGVSKAAYCFAKQLNDSNSINCVDSAGYVGAISSISKCNSTTFSCSK
jgi:hypothetical protein